ncbi:MAG: hypothetical protein AAGG80_02570, partial [Pseudomonadota bacterium]
MPKNSPDGNNAAEKTLVKIIKNTNFGTSQDNLEQFGLLFGCSLFGILSMLPYWDAGKTAAEKAVMPEGELLSQNARYVLYIGSGLYLNFLLNIYGAYKVMSYKSDKMNLSWFISPKYKIKSLLTDRELETQLYHYTVEKLNKY